jgi:hypothetical protein
MPVAKKTTLRERRERWIEALESGRYKQTDGTLREVNGKNASYCCLGVLCDLEMEKGQRWTSSHGSEFVIKPLFTDVPTEVPFGGYVDYPPDSILKKLKVSDDLAKTLADMNDSGKTFKDIAAFLRKKWRMPSSAT